MSDAYLAAEQEFIAGHAKDADIVITTALIPGKPAPKLLTSGARSPAGRAGWSGRSPAMIVARCVHDPVALGQRAIPALLAASRRRPNRSSC